MRCAQCGATLSEVGRFELRGHHQDRFVSAQFCSLPCLTLYAVECLVDALADPALSRNGTR
jgi:hypothetical protein